MGTNYKTPEESPLGVAVNTPTEWETLLWAELTKGGSVRDEYGASVPLMDLLDKVRAKRDGSRRNHEYATQSEEGDDVIYTDFS